MRKHVEIITAANELHADLTKSFDEFITAKQAKIDALGTLPADEAHEAVVDLVNGAKAIIAGVSSADGTVFPKYLTGIKTYDTDGKLDVVVLTIKSRLKDVAKYKVDYTIKLDADFAKNFVNAYIESIFALYYRNEATANLADVNAFIEKVCAENSIPYVFSFEIADDAKSYITYIDDTKVVFNADVDAALKISKDGLFTGGDSYSDLVRDQLVDKLVETLSATPTTVQLLKAKVDLISTLVGYSTRKRADRLIRGSYHKKAEYFGRVKSGFGYFEKEINKDTSIFAILEKHEDGEITVALSPFDIKTLLNYDLDVVAEVKSLL